MIKPGKWIEKISERLVNPGAGRLWRPLGWLVLVLLLLDLVFGCYWSREPDVLDAPAVERPATGQATTGTLIRVIDTLLEKPGGYLSNDITPHRLWLDNMPNWEYGVLLQVRDLTQVLRRQIGRGDAQDEDLAQAASQLQFERTSWAMPATENEYRRGARALRRYQARLAEGGEAAVFKADAASLGAWLAEVQGRLDDLSLRLSQSVGRPVTGYGDQALEVRTPRFQVDNIFYEARGTGWALYHLLLAAEQDFRPLLVHHQADANMRRAIRELRASTEAMRSPFILNGSGFGMFANHSLVMGNYLARANAALGEVRAALKEPG